MADVSVVDPACPVPLVSTVSSTQYLPAILSLSFVQPPPRAVGRSPHCAGYGLLRPAEEVQNHSHMDNGENTRGTDVLDQRSIAMADT